MMKKPIAIKPSIAASGTWTLPGTINLIRCRTFSVSLRSTCGASIDANILVEAFYSPDGNNWDSVSIDSYEVDFSAGSTVQESAVLKVPEHGYIYLKVTNLSDADTLTGTSIWYSIQSHNNTIDVSMGSVEKKGPYQ